MRRVRRVGVHFLSSFDWENRCTFWFGLAAPTGTPNAIVKRLNALLREAVTDPEVAKTVQRQAINPAPSTPAEFAARIRTDYAKWKRVLEGS